MAIVTLAVEGDTDASIARALLNAVGLEAGNVYGLRGKNALDARLRAYNSAARHTRWFVLRDLDNDAACAPLLAHGLLPAPVRGMCFRVAVRAAESWLLGDRERLSQFLAVAIDRLPLNPDELDDPKQMLVNLARHSRRRAVRDDIVPRRGLSARVGAGYTARLIQFAGEHWRPDVAAQTSSSLAKCLAALRRWRP